MIRAQKPILISICVVLPLFAKAGEATVDDVLTKMDQAAPSFKGMASNIDQMKYTAVISDKSTESGSFLLKKNNANLTVLIDFKKPDSKTIRFSGKIAEIYYPEMKTVQEYNLGKQSNMVEQFLMLGFGTTGKDLKANYDVKLLGQESVAGRPAYHLLLVPKSASVKEQFNKFEVWMDEGGSHPVQQKVYQPSGDYYLITYTDIKVNPPLSDAALMMKLPKGVKREKH